MSSGIECVEVGQGQPGREALHCYGRRSIERRSMPAAAAAALFCPLISFRHFCGDHASVIGAESARLRSIEHSDMTPLMPSFGVCCLSRCGFNLPSFTTPVKPPAQLVGPPILAVHIVSSIFKANTRFHSLHGSQFTRGYDVVSS